MTFQFLTNVLATGAGSSFKPLRGAMAPKIQTGVFQVDLGGGSATVAIEGRANANAPWLALYTFTTSGVQAIQLMNEMRGNVTAYTSGTINGYFNG